MDVSKRKLIFPVIILLTLLVLIPINVNGQDNYSKQSVNKIHFSESHKLQMDKIRSEYLIHKSLIGSKQNEPIHKISSDLLELISGDRQIQRSGSLEEIGQFKPAKSITNNARKISESLVYVYISVNNSSMINEIESLVNEITNYDKENKLVIAWIKVENLEKLASMEDVGSIRSVVPPVVNSGGTLTEGDLIHRTKDVRTLYGNSGAGIKVGIISNGVRARATAQASGDLPADGAGLTVLSDAVGGEEGTAMLEIVHDIVPDAELFFHDCGRNWLAFNTAIDALITAGCNVICDDIGWLTVPFFEDGVIASHITNRLLSNDIIYVSSAGNDAQNHHQSDFYPLSGYPNYHDFSAGTETMSDMYCNIPDGGTILIVLQWNDEYGNSANDYNMELVSWNSGLIEAGSYNIQNGNDDPYEYILYTANGSTEGDFSIMVTKNSSASSKTLELFIHGFGGGAGNYLNNTSPIDAVYGHAAAEGVVSVGAIRASDPGNDDIEWFSSQGPSTIIGETEPRHTPKISGIDGVSVTGAGGFPSTFYGTSAAAPHVAAIAAMTWSAVPLMSGNDVKNMLYNSAVDLGDSGFDYVFGHGRADALSIFNDNSLSVELSRFDANFENGKNVLTWETASEIQNVGFIIDRKNNSEWTKLSSFKTNESLKGYGSTTESHTYTFIDENVIPGQTYEYRITDVDYNGNLNIHKDIQTVTIPETSENLSDNYSLSEVYPNPFNPTTNIQFQLPVKSNVAISIYDMNGKNIENLFTGEKSAGIYNFKWNASSFSSGVYFIQMKAGTFFSVQKCILVK